MGNAFTRSAESFKPCKGWGSSVDSLIDDSWELMQIRWRLLGYSILSRKEWVNVLIQWRERYSVLIDRYLEEKALIEIARTPQKNFRNLERVLNKCVLMMLVVSNNKKDEFYITDLENPEICNNNEIFDGIIKRYDQMMITTFFLHTCSMPELEEFIRRSTNRIEEQKNRYLGRINDSTTVESHAMNIEWLNRLYVNRKLDIADDAELGARQNRDDVHVE